MNNIQTACLALALIILFFSPFHQDDRQKQESHEPNDYFFLQRAFPYDKVPSEAYYAAVDWAQSQVQQRSGPDWEMVGPANVGGRITDIAMHASDQQTIYVASASGGIWKSVNAGQSWFPISDALPSLSIGDIAIDPSDKNTLYCGTGETNGGGGSVTYDGQGLFKSTDAGSSWVSIGLEKTGSIGRIEVDPKNPKRIFVATMGHLFANNPDRGLYRSDDGGLSWSQKLFINDSTGVIDLVVNPVNPDTIYAVAWERVRRPSIRRYGGPGCGIFRSTDGGDNWIRLAGGLPQSNLGRMGIAIAPSSPNILYVTIATESGAFGGTYKSLDHGNSWTPMSNQSSPTYSSYGWWFGQIRAHPTNPDKVYNLGLYWVTTSNGGSSWHEIGSELHVDHHALYIHPANPNFMVEGNDGGVYISENAGLNWDFHPLPITQFYTSEIDFQNPQRLYGGTQDNGTWRTSDPNPDLWDPIWGGDGFVTLVNPNNSLIWYAEYQYGGLGGSNGAKPPVFSRANWNAPYVFDPNNPDIMYFGAESLYKSVNGGLNWTAISGGMSTSPPGTGGIVYGTLTTIAVSPVNGKVIWAGTDDGNVWVTPNGGGIWNKVSDALPKRWITRLVAHPYDASIAYVCLSGFRHADEMAHIYKTVDQGQSWEAVSGNLPDIPVNDLVLDPIAPGKLIIATDAGVFISYDDGANWAVLGAGLPNVPILDLTFHEPTRTLVAASYGRSMFRTYLPLPVGVGQPAEKAKLTFFPNPVSDLLTIKLDAASGQASHVRVWNSAGKLVFQEKVSAGLALIKIDARNWKPGVYVLLLEDQSRKMVKY